NAAVLFFSSTSGLIAQGDLDMSPAHEQLLNGLMPNTTYTFELFSFDVAGNPSVPFAGSFTTQPLSTDDPPSKPDPVNPPSVTNAATVTITWGASHDDTGVTEYRIYRDGDGIGTVAANTLTFDDTGATEGTHTYKVGAVDFAGHVTLSDPVIVVVD